MLQLQKVGQYKKKKKEWIGHWLQLMIIVRIDQSASVLRELFCLKKHQ